MFKIKKVLSYSSSPESEPPSEQWEVPTRGILSKNSHDENRLNQCQGNFFMPQKCAQSIFRLEKPLDNSFLSKIGHVMFRNLTFRKLRF